MPITTPVVLIKIIPLLLWIFLLPNCASMCWHDPHTATSAPMSHAQSDLTEVKGDRGNGLNFNWPACHGEVSIWTVPAFTYQQPQNPYRPRGKLNLVRCTLSTFLCSLLLPLVHLSCSVSVFIVGEWWCFNSSSVLEDIGVYLKSYSGLKGAVINMCFVEKQQRIYSIYNMPINEFSSSAIQLYHYHYRCH